MGAIGGLLGVSGGAGGSGFGGPGGSSQGVSPIVNPTSQSQINSAYGGANSSMQAQQALLQAIQGQNGLANQSNSYNQLQGIANGTGPNPAQAQYQQNIQGLAQQQAGALASTKGISPALQARLISQQGSSAMQSAAGQGAANLATQQLGAINSAAGIAGTQASNQIGQTNANTQAQQAEQQALLGAQASANSANAGLQGNINSTNAGLAQTQMQGGQNLIGGVLNGVGSILANGGEVAQAPTIFLGENGAPASGPQSKFGQFLKSASSAGSISQQNQASNNTQMPALEKGASSFSAGIGRLLKGSPQSNAQDFASQGPMAGPDVASAGDTMMAANGGKVKALVSPGEHRLPAKEVKEVARGKNPLSVGETFPGKPKVPGNSYANDVIPKKLNAGDIIIPNSIMQSKDPANGAARFVQTILAKRGAKK